MTDTLPEDRTPEDETAGTPEGTAAVAPDESKPTKQIIAEALERPGFTPDDGRVFATLQRFESQLNGSLDPAGTDEGSLTLEEIHEILANPGLSKEQREVYEALRDLKVRLENL